METYILDCSTWRCGGDFKKSKFGAGATMLLNPEGYMCCLGQFAANDGVDYKDLLETRNCCALAKKVGIYNSKFVELLPANPPKRNKSTWQLTPLTVSLLHFNDSPLYTFNQRIELIKNKLSEHDIALEVRNNGIV